VLLFNPTSEVLKRIIRLPLYYTGLKDVALVRLKDKQELMVRPGHDRSIELTVNIPPGGYTWYVIR
jgi:hypothetical protein